MLSLFCFGDSLLKCLYMYNVVLILFLHRTIEIAMCMYMPKMNKVIKKEKKISPKLVII